MRRIMTGFLLLLVGLIALPFVPAGIAPPVLWSTTPLLARVYANRALGVTGGQHCVSPENYAYDPRTTVPDRRLVPEAPETTLTSYLTARVAAPAAPWMGFALKWVEIGNHNTDGLASIRVGLRTLAGDEERVFVLRADHWRYVWLDIGTGLLNVDRFLCTADFSDWQIQGELVPGVVAPGAVPLSGNGASH